MGGSMEKEGSLGSLERVWAVRFRIQGRRVPTPLVQMITTLPERQQQHSGEGLLSLWRLFAYTSPRKTS